jgi:uncharacterized cupredoxin-like copper-binding protein
VQGLAQRVVAGCVLIALVAFDAGVSMPAHAADRGATVAVYERDYRINAGRQPVAAGPVTLVVRNGGPDMHELIVVHDRGRRLPLRSDGLTVDEDAVASAKVGNLEPAEPGVRTLHLRLAPGRYIMFCNMAGHELAGMHTELVVR